MKTQSNPDVKVFMIGNKLDLEQKRKVTKDMAQKFTENNDLDLFIETSAETGFNAKQVFIEAAKVLYKDYLKYKERGSKTSSIDPTQLQYNSHIKLPSPNNMNIQTEENKKNKKCC